MSVLNKSFSAAEINKIEVTQLDFIADKKLYLFLAKKDAVDFVYNTSALEGNAMSYPEVETLLQGVTVGGHKLSDEQQILNQHRSLRLLFSLLEKNTFTMDQASLCLLHAEVAREEALQWGVFRESNVNIGGTEYLPPAARLLKPLFEEGLQIIHQIHNVILKALTYFLFGARSQFFYDGNKRVSRLMMNGILLSAGFPMLNIKAKKRLELNQQMIAFYDSGDFIAALEYLRDLYEISNHHIK